MARLLGRAARALISATTPREKPSQLSDRPSTSSASASASFIARMFATRDRPSHLEDHRKGPGPLKPQKMSEKEHKKFWDKMTARGFEPKEDERWVAEPYVRTGGLLHRSVPPAPDVVGVTKDTAANFKKLIEAPEGAYVTPFRDGGGFKVIDEMRLNLLSKCPDLPVVVLSKGPFDWQWLKDLKEYSDKGFIGKIVPVEVPFGESPTQYGIEKALTDAGYSSEQQFNITGTIVETGAGTVLSEETMDYIAHSPRIVISAMDSTTALLVHKINDKITHAGAQQKGLDGPNDLGFVYVAPKHVEYLSVDSTLPLPKANSWSERDNNGNLAPNYAMAKGQDITRSTSVGSILKLNYSIERLRQKATKEKAAQQVCIEEAARSSQFCQDALQEHIDQRKAEGKEPMLEFVVSDPKIRCHFNLTIKFSKQYINDIGEENLKNVTDEAHAFLAEQGRAFYISRFKGSPEEVAYRYTTMGVNSKEEAKKITDNLIYASEKARKKITRESEIDFEGGTMPIPAKMRSRKTGGLLNPLLSMPPKRDVHTVVVANTLVEQADVRTMAEGYGGTYVEGELKEEHIKGKGKDDLVINDRRNLTPEQITKVVKKAYDLLSEEDKLGLTYGPEKLEPQVLEYTNAGADRTGSGVFPEFSDAAKKLGVRVSNTPEGNSMATVTSAIGALLQVRGGPNREKVRYLTEQGEMDSANIAQHKHKRGFEGKAVGISGITSPSGKLMLNALQALGVENFAVWGRDKERTQAAINELNEGIKQQVTIQRVDTLEELAEKSDILSVNMKLVPGSLEEGGTEKIFNEQVLSKLPQGATVVAHSCRDGSFDFDAVEKAMDNGQIEFFLSDFGRFPGKPTPFDGLQAKYGTSPGKGEQARFRDDGHMDVDPDLITQEKLLNQAIRQQTQWTSREIAINSVSGTPFGAKEERQEPGAPASRINQNTRITREIA